MKYCVSARQDKETLQKADEILVEARDYKIIPEFFELYPDKTIIIDFNENIPMIQLTNFSTIGNLVCRISNLREQLDIAVENDLKFYYRYPVNTFYDLNSLLSLNPYYVVIASPLTFHLSDLKKYNGVRFRINPTKVNDGDYIPRENGICGQYIRPEDIDLYEDVIHTIEFSNSDASLNRERALLKIYKEDKQWLGNLRMLIPDLKVDVDNRGLPKDFGARRLNCNQKCQQTGRCHYCENVFDFCNTIKKLLY